tara:strand:- start:25077 stop:26342 length:1266 start_codon:yes stop_codon:yes gene_type:complete
MFNRNISVIGLGYIGLPTAAIIASKGINVIGVDINKDVVDTINTGKIHIVEPDLENIVFEAVKNGFLKAVFQPEPADIYIIAVPTPFLAPDEENKIPKPDLSFIKEASKLISKVLKKGDLVILESTSPVGTTERLSSWLSEETNDLSFPHTHGEDSDIRIAYCPERVLPGQVIKELVTNDRIIGGITKKCSKSAIELYKTFLKGKCVSTSSRTAEMAKLTENASRDVSIAFANELSIICENLNVDVRELIDLANRHPRVNILQPGCGVGGHCIPVDPWFIASQNPHQANLIKCAREINDSKPDWIVEKVKVEISKFLSENKETTKNNFKIACYGLAFKPNIDDLRESPALKIAKKLGIIFNGQVIAVEPNISTYNANEFELVSLQKAIDSADIHVFLVGHTEFKDIQVDKKNALDFCGLLN